MNEQRRIARTRIVGSRVFDEYTVKAYDQWGKRWPECDYFTTDREDAKQTAAKMIRKDDNGSN